MRTEQEIRDVLEFIKNEAPNMQNFSYKDGWRLSLEWVLGEES